MLVFFSLGDRECVLISFVFFKSVQYGQLVGNLFMVVPQALIIM